MNELQRHLENKTLNYEHIYKCVKLCCNVVALCKPVAEYLVGRGYDSDELAALGTRRAIKFIDSFS